MFVTHVVLLTNIPWFNSCFLVEKQFKWCPPGVFILGRERLLEGIWGRERTLLQIWTVAAVQGLPVSGITMGWSGLLGSCLARHFGQSCGEQALQEPRLNRLRVSSSCWEMAWGAPGKQNTQVCRAQRMLPRETQLTIWPMLRKPDKIPALSRL